MHHLLIRGLFIAALVLGTGLPSATSAHAAEAATQPNWLQAIDRLVRKHLPVSASSHHIDILTPEASVEHLQHCAKIDARFNRTPTRLAGRTMVTLSCADRPGSAPRFVQINVSVIGQYLVAARDLPAQHNLTRNDIAIEQGDLASLPRHALLATPNAIQTALGQQLRRALQVHSVLQENLMSRPNVVNFGDEIVIETSGAGFQITRSGEAMDTGAIGDIIRVRLNNKQLLRVEVIAAGRAKPAQ